MRGVPGALLAIIIVVPSFALQSSASDWPGPTSPRVEWNIDLPWVYGTVGSNFTDLDGDGSDEMMINWGRNYTFYDPPSYNVLLALNDPTISDIEFVRIQNATAMDILVTYRTESHFNVSVIPGSDFKEAWRSPNINGTRDLIVSHDTVHDVDADGRPEFVFPVLDSETTCFEVFDAMTYDLEWSSPRLGGEQPYLAYCLQDVDGDPAFELLTADIGPNDSGGNNISAYDGATHEKQWTVSLPGDYHFLTAWERFSDIDNDSEKELVLPYISGGEPGDQTCGLNVYSAQNGTLEWGIGPWPGWLYINSMDDLDGDGWKELLMICTTSGVDEASYCTYSVFGPKENRSLWTTGPILSMDNESYQWHTDDLERDGTPEMIFFKRMAHGAIGMTATYQVLRGPEFSIVWTSPEIWESVNGPWTLTYLPSDGSAARILLVEGISSHQGATNSTLTIFSATDFRVLFNRSYPGELQISVVDWDGDLNPELLLQYHDCELLDGNGFSTVWKAPWHDWPNLEAADLCGGPEYEILSKTGSGGYRTINGTSREWHTSVLSVHDSQTLEQIWASQSLDGKYHTNYVADIDNDTNIEVLYRVDRYDQQYSVSSSFVMIEFPRESPTTENPWPPGLNMRPPTITIEKPKNGQKVSGTVKITGTAEDDTFLSRIEIRIDDGEWVNSSWTLGAGNLTCSWNHGWDSSQASKGAHKISARAFDGTSWSSESSVTVEVRPPGTTTPGWPKTTIAGFPDPACIILMMVALIAAVAAFLIHRRRK